MGLVVVLLQIRFCPVIFVFHKFNMKRRENFVLEISRFYIIKNLLEKVLAGEERGHENKN